MAFMDFLKRQVQQTVRLTGNQVAKKVISQVENKSYTVKLQQLPTSLEQMQAMPEASLTDPQNTAALTVAALCMYPTNQEAAVEMLNFLQGPRGITPYDKQFLRERFRDKDYVPRSYFKGATPQNNYEPTQPYTIIFSENPYSRGNINEGYLTLYVQSGGADSPRQIKLRQKPSTGQWFLWEQFLLADIRMPVSKDPWA